MATLAALPLLLLLLLPPATSPASASLLSDLTEEERSTVEEALQRVGNLHHRGGPLGGQNDTAASSYQIGAEIQVLNFLRVPLRRGSASAEEGRVASAPAAEVPPGTMTTFAVDGGGRGGGDDAVGGAAQFTVGLLRQRGKII